jgi:hypothetical protein
MGLFKRTPAPTTQLPTEPVTYPVGSAVESEGKYFYIKSNSIRMRIPSKYILDSWNFHRVIHTNEIALKNYKIMGKLGFRSGSLIHNVADGKIYLVSENKLRHILSPEALERIGAVYSDAVTVPDADIKLHDIGDPLT